MAIKLIFSSISPPSRAIKLLIKILNLKIELVETDILSQQYLKTDLPKINPQHTVPTLIDGDYVLWDSHAIAIYLTQKYAKSDSLYPKDPKQRGIINQRLHFDTGILYPCVYNSIYPILFKGKQSPSTKDAVAIKRAYSHLDKFLKNSTWLAGKNLTLADVCSIPTITTLDYMIPVVKNTPNLFNYLQNCQNLPHYEKSNQEGLDILGSLVQEKIIRNSVAKSK